MVCAVAFGDDEPGPDYKHLKQLEWSIGSWVLEVEAPEDAPPESPVVVKKGDLIKAILTLKWGLNKNVLHTTATVLVNGKVVSEEAGITGWDSEKKQIIARGFDAFGGTERTTTRIVDDRQLELTTRKIMPDGAISEFVIEVKSIDPGTLTTQRTNIWEKGSGQPDEPVVTWKRTK